MFIISAYVSQNFSFMITHTLQPPPETLKRNHLYDLGHGRDGVGLARADAELGGLVDLPVDEEHHAEWQVEGAKVEKML